MALLFVDGFDNCDTSMVVAATKWTAMSSPSTSATNPRTGARCFSMSSGAANLQKTVLPTGGFIVGAAWWVQTPLSGSQNDFYQIREVSGPVVHLALMMDSSRRLVVKRGTTTLATGTTVVPINAWYYVEFKGTIDSVAGDYEVRIDGVLELSDSGINTRNGGTGLWNNLFIQIPWTGPSPFLDDVYIADTSGPRNNTFLGPVKIETLLPQTDAVAVGSTLALTPSTGTDHGALVDEPQVNTTDYNSSATVGAKDTYNYPALTLTSAVLGVQTNIVVQKSDTLPRAVCAVVRSGGVDYDGATLFPTTSWTVYPEMREVNPNTGLPWTIAEVNAMEAGMKVTV